MQDTKKALRPKVFKDTNYYYSNSTALVRQRIVIWKSWSQKSDPQIRLAY